MEAPPKPGQDLPRVSVVIPVLNEELHILDCLRSVIDQDYPRELIDIVVADGGSSDRTRELVVEVSAGDRRVRLIDNPGRNQASGLNRAIAATSGEVVARLDGHAAWRPGHLRESVRLLLETGSDNVGGTMGAVGETAVARAAARAWRSPFAAGGARYRYRKRQLDTDTVFLGVFRRTALDRVGPFREDLDQHEDYELNHRIRLSGGRVVFSPELSTRYWTRSDWGSLAAQFFRYGRAKARVARTLPGVVRPYHLIPPIFALTVPVAAVALLGKRGRKAVGILAAMYALTDLGAALGVAAGEPAPETARTMVAFPVMQLSWGAGFLVGLWESVRRRAWPPA